MAEKIAVPQSLKEDLNGRLDQRNEGLVSESEVFDAMLCSIDDAGLIGKLGSNHEVYELVHRGNVDELAGRFELDRKES